MSPLELIKATGLMQRFTGIPDIVIGLIDGSILIDHPDFAGKIFREISGRPSESCVESGSVACAHGTYVAGILSARRGALAPAISPDCTLLIRPVFFSKISEQSHALSATPKELALAIVECIDAGARIINLSLALAQPSSNEEKTLTEALNYAARYDVIVVAAAGNQGTLASSAITRHPWVIPVTACDPEGRPLNDSNLSRTIALRGLSAPGENVTSLGIEGQPLTLGGTSVAVPFVTGTAALLWSAFPAATATQIKQALLTATPRKVSIVPPLLNAFAAYQFLSGNYFSGQYVYP